MKRILTSILIIFFLQFCAVARRRDLSGSLAFGLNDPSEVIVRQINRELLLRITKEGRAAWNVEVVRKPYRPDASVNLLYHSLAWHGPYPSQVEAWQIAEKYFPNRRQLGVSGYPYKVTINLIDPVVEGNGSGARFVLGSVRISWSRTALANPPAERLPETRDSTVQPSRVYILKAWQMADDPKIYLWSLEDQSQSDSSHTIYKSLSSASLRDKVSSFPPGTRISFYFRGGGSPATPSAVRERTSRTSKRFASANRSWHY